LRPSIESMMRLSLMSSTLTSFASFSASTILQNGQARETHFLDTKIDRIDTNSTAWKTYGANATELSYKGRWDSKHISWWAYVPVISYRPVKISFQIFPCKVSNTCKFPICKYPVDLRGRLRLHRNPLSSSKAAS
jgi:hypothetical protein